MNNAAALRVASDLRHNEVEKSPDHPQDVLLDSAVYRILDAPYYAWLRRRMERAKRAHDAGKLPTPTWQTLRERFNAIHAWAIEHLGEDRLLRAVEDLDEKSYRAPRHDKALAWLESWEERAAIMEYDGGMSREEAECRATDLLTQRLTREHIDSFKALGIPFGIKRVPSELTLFPQYAGHNDRVDIDPRDLVGIYQGGNP